MKKKKINNNKIKNLNQEIYKTYENNSWEVYAKTQVNTSFVSKQKFINELNLDINKKIVVLFSHIYFDATFSWGENIFNDYEDWLCMSIKSLLKNKNINIILKIHPANISKNFSDKKNKFKEINSLKKTLNKIPKNLKIILPDSKISTYSVIKFMDVCITVRGTVGIEAILQKKLVLTCGSGRYDRLGFTKDFANRSKYLKYLEKSNFETNKKINFKLGEKFAYYSMVKRPFFPKTTISKYILKKANFPNCFFSPKNLNDKKFKSDFKKLTDWIKNKDEDYLN